MVLYVVNRSAEEPLDAEIALTSGRFFGEIRVCTINGLGIKSENTFQAPNEVTTKESSLTAKERTLSHTLEPHSVTALKCQIS
jgi:alpha-L-arabinofuranosidase